MGRAVRRTRILQVLAKAERPLTCSEIVNACLSNQRPHKGLAILLGIRDGWIWGGYRNELFGMQADGLVLAQWVEGHKQRVFYLPRDANPDGSYYPRPT